jgi:hypothetical protein
VCRYLCKDVAYRSGPRPAGQIFTAEARWKGLPLGLQGITGGTKQQYTVFAHTHTGRAVPKKRSGEHHFPQCTATAIQGAAVAALGYFDPNPLPDYVNTWYCACSNTS